VPRISFPWSAWYQDTTHTLEFPSHWTVEQFDLPERRAFGEQEIANALDRPIESQTLEELSFHVKSACIVVDDLARPTPASQILPRVIRKLTQRTLRAEDLKIVIATGTHGKLNEQQIAWKVGQEISHRFDVQCHDCNQELEGSGIKYGNDELRINRTFLNSELRIAIGSVLPHSFAGYSGGAKLVLPGLADVCATSRSHKFVQLGLRGGSNLEKNRFRTEAEEIVKKIGLDFFIGVSTNSKREIVDLHAGDVVEAHRTASAHAKTYFKTQVDGQYDCLVLNAFPKDVDLIQSENVFVALKTATKSIVKEDGVILVVTAASEGLGKHGLFQPGGANYRRPVQKRAFGNRELWIYSPSVSEADVRHVYWEGYPFFKDSRSLSLALKKRFPNECRAAIFMTAPMQQIVTLESH